MASVPIATLSPAIAPGVARTLAPTPPPTPAPQWPLTLAAVGDIMLGRSISYYLPQDAPNGPFAGVSELLTATDITVANLEVALTDRGFPEAKGYTFRAPALPSAKRLREAGFDVLSLANNHILDYGAEGLADSLRALRQHGMAGVGAGANADGAYHAVVLERNGVRIAFLAFAEVPNEAGYDMKAWTAGENKPGIAWAEDSRVVAGVAASAEQAEIVVVLFHFGNEFQSVPSTRQRELARMAINAGADLVIGSHPHVLQQVEEYGGGLIAYSLGNFVFDGFEGVANESAVLLVSFDEGGVSSWRMEPVEIGWDGLPRLLSNLGR